MHSNMLGLFALLSVSMPIVNALSPAAVIPEEVQPAAKELVQAAAENNNTPAVGGNDGNRIDGVLLADIPEGRAANAIVAQAITPASWTATASDENPGYPAKNVLDDNLNTFYHSRYQPNNAPLPHTITIDMKQNYRINSISYIPRQDGQGNGNVGQHRIQISENNVQYTTVAFGTYKDDKATKTTIFDPVNARYVRFIALSEAGNRGPYTSIASLSIFQTTDPVRVIGNRDVVGEWSPTIDFPLVPVAMGMEHDTNKVLVWSSYAASTFGGSPGGNTLTATYDPATGTVSQRNVQNTFHDMFCPGISVDSTGRFIVTGGNSAPKTSIFSPKNDAWTPGPNMKIARGYQASAMTSEGKMFVIGGSWSGGQGNKNGELYNPFTSQYTLLRTSPVSRMLTADSQGVFRQDNHGWLFGWKRGYVLQAGPSKQMNWYGTGLPDGGATAAGPRAADFNAMCGNAVMYDAVAGKILTLGGSSNYQDSDATANAHVLTVGEPNQPVRAQKINNMWFRRIFADAVVLPDGKVFITGGQVHGKPFSDDTSTQIPELWNPATTQFIKLAKEAIPRTYHSAALLLPDATVISGGGGLCGNCATNHYDAQIYSPPYLFNADGSRATRPVITNAPATVNVGTSFTVTTNVAITSWSMVRLGSATHTVNTDQRRIPLKPSRNNGNTYTIPTPTDAGILLPGYYYLFALNGQGVPSIAKYIWVPTPNR